MLDADALSELKFLFPKLFETEMRPPPARPFHSGRKDIDKLRMRLSKNSKPFVEAYCA